MYLPDGYTTRLVCFGCRPRWIGAPRTVVGCGGSCRPVWGWWGRRVVGGGWAWSMNQYRDQNLRTAGCDRWVAAEDAMILCVVIWMVCRGGLEQECCWIIGNLESKLCKRRVVVRCVWLCDDDAPSRKDRTVGRLPSKQRQYGWPDRGLFASDLMDGTRRRVAALACLAGG